MWLIFLSILSFILRFNSYESAQVLFDVSQVPKYYTPLNDDLYLAGSFNGWFPNSTEHKLTRLSHSVFMLNTDLPIGTHQYKFTRGSWASGESNADGTSMANRNLVISTNSLQSVVVKINNWDDMKGRHTASGNVLILHSKFPYPQFNTYKRIWIYLPNDYYTSTKSYSVVYMHDAQNLFDSLYSFAGEWGIDETMENFFRQGKETSIVVGLETTYERMDELTPFSNPTYGGGQGDKYLDFVVNNLKPYIDLNFRTKSDRANTGVAGSSLGGLMSFYMGVKRQDIFGKIGVFSPSFWFSDKIYDFALTNRITYPNTKIYFVCGQTESSTMGSDMLKMITLLRSYGFNGIQYLIQADGQHSEWFWNREFPSAYSWLFY